MRKQSLGESASIRERASYRTLGEAIRREWLPMALSIGIGSAEFWELSPSRLEPYVRAHEIREKRRLEGINLEGWLIGIYVTYSLGCAFSQNSQYPEKPFDLFGGEISPEERSKQEAAAFAAYADEFNRRLKKEEK